MQQALSVSPNQDIMLDIENDEATMMPLLLYLYKCSPSLLPKNLQSRGSSPRDSSWSDSLDVNPKSKLEPC